MNTENTILDVNDSMVVTLNNLKQSRNAWEKEQNKTDKMLHRLLDECLQLLQLCKGSEYYEQALKSVVNFKFGKKTRLSIIICKSVFGAGKQHYAYAKSLDKACENEIGINDNISMFDWLQANGGVNAVIRKDKSNTRLENAEFAEYVLDGYYNFNRLKKSLQPLFTFKK